MVEVKQNNNFYKDGKKMKRTFSRTVLGPILVLAVMIVAIGYATAKEQSRPEPVPEIRPGTLKGYLEMEDLPNAKSLIPPPPEKGSAARALDDAVSKQMLKLKGSARFKLATKDAELHFPEAAEAFSCALGIPITDEHTPYLYMLMRRSLTDAGLSTYTAKNQYQRKRPFMENGQPTCTPQDEAYLRKDGSYPSGHTAIGWAWALILTEIAPERTNEILARGRAFGVSRNVCNVHWHSDVLEGRFMAASTVARLHADAKFQADLIKAKVEYAAAMAKGLKPRRDCAAEMEALKQ